MLFEVTSNFLRNLRGSRYSNLVSIDIEKQFYEFNCYSFVVYLLSRMDIEVKSKRAFEFYSEIQTHSIFEEVKNLDELSSGDIIIWRKDVIPKSGDTGHVAVVLEINLPYIRIADCVKEPHFRDSRVTSGIGVGDLELILNEDKSRAKGFVWSDKRKKTKYTNILFYRTKSDALRFNK